MRAADSSEMEYRQLWASMWELGTESRFSEQSVRSQGCKAEVTQLPSMCGALVWTLDYKSKNKTKIQAKPCRIPKAQSSIPPLKQHTRKTNRKHCHLKTNLELSHLMQEWKKNEWWEYIELTRGMVLRHWHPRDDIWGLRASMQRTQGWQKAGASSREAEGEANSIQLLQKWQQTAEVSPSNENLRASLSMSII